MATTTPSYLTVGPGSLKFTPTGGTALDCSVYVRSVKVSASTSSSDGIQVLSGDVLAGETTTTYTLDVTAFQSLAEGHLTHFSWKNANNEVEFEYSPSNANSGAKITGKCVVAPITIGGEAGEKPTSDFTWTIVGLPTFTPAGGSNSD